MKLVEKSILLLLAVALTPLILTSTFFYVQLRNNIAREVFDRLESIATIQQNHLEELNQHNYERLKSLTSRLQLRTSLDLYNQRGRTPDQVQVQRIIQDTHDLVPALRTITILSPTGKVVASTEPGLAGTSRSDWEVFKRGLTSESVNQIFKHPSGELRLYLTGPLAIEGRIVGVAVIESSAENLLAATGDYSGLGQTGEIVLGQRRPGGEVIYVAPLRFKPQAALSVAVQPGEDAPIARALLGHQTTFTDSIDYRRQPVLIATRFVSGADWGLAVKIDKAEAFAATTRLRDLLLLLVFVFSVVVVMLAVSLTWRLTGQILALDQAAHRLSNGNLAARVPILSRDEAGRVAASFNTMAGELATLYKELDAKVKEKTTYLQAIIDHLPVGVFVAKAPTGEPELSNPVGVQLLGRVLDPTVTRDQYTQAYDVVKEDGSPYPVKELPLTIALTQGRAVTKDDIYVRHPDGTSIPLRVSSVPIKDPSGRLTSALAVFSDRTTEKELAVERAKGEFVALASHQLRTPATGVKAFVSMLMDGYGGKLSAKQLHFLRKAYDSNERQLRVINGMLNVALIESGGAIFNKQPVNLGNLLKSVVAEQSATAAERQQKLVLAQPRRSIIVEVDADKLRMAVDNLVSNALKYTPSGGKVSIVLKAGAKHVTVSVTDTGVGIARNELGRLFKRFSRIDNPLSLETGAGSGLGLYLARNIVAAHDGEITVASRPGAGSTFSIELPYGKKPTVKKVKPSINRRPRG